VKQKKAKQLKISMNGKPVDTAEGWSLSAAKRWVVQNVTSTHMGEWHRLETGFEYATTIGQYSIFSLRWKCSVKKQESNHGSMATNWNLFETNQSM
jgi:hypothetical protein